MIFYTKFLQVMNIGSYRFFIFNGNLSGNTKYIKYIMIYEQNLK